MFYYPEDMVYGHDAEVLRHVATTHLSLECEPRPSIRRPGFTAGTPIPPLIDVSFCINASSVLLM